MRIIILLFLLPSITLAAPLGKLPIMASRANCPAVSHVGAGAHNESVSWYVNDKHDLWVRSWQKSKRGTVRSIDSAWGYEWTWRAYAGFVDSGVGVYTDWTVNGHHAIRFSFTDIRTTQTTATNCNLSAGWPWSG